MHLEKSGTYEVQEVHRAEQALDVAAAFQPDLILLDVIMPGIDGAQIAVRLKGDATFRDTPLRLLTISRSEDEAKEREGRIGRYPFIEKPVSPEQVMASIAKYL